MTGLHVDLLLAKIPIQSPQKTVKIFSLGLAGSVSNALCGLKRPRECTHEHS